MDIGSIHELVDSASTTFGASHLRETYEGILQVWSLMNMDMRLAWKYLVAKSTSSHQFDIHFRPRNQFR